MEEKEISGRDDKERVEGKRREAERRGKNEKRNGIKKLCLGQWWTEEGSEITGRKKHKIHILFEEPSSACSIQLVYIEKPFTATATASDKPNSCPACSNTTPPH